MKKWMLIMLSLLLLVTAGCGKQDIPDLPATITPGALLENSDSETTEDTTQLSLDANTEEGGEEADAPPVTENKDDADENKKDEKPSKEETSHKNEDKEENNDKDNGKEEEKTPSSGADVIAGGLWDGGPVTWEITADGVLTIEGNRSVQPKKTYIWWDYGDTVTKVVIGEGITNVPEYAFRGMASLREVSLSNTVTTIEERAFAGCPALTTVTIPASVTMIETSAFSHCKALRSISFASGGAGLTIGQYAFAKSGLTSFTAPPQLRTIESHAFTQCEQLQTIRLEGGVSTIKARAFESCPALQHLVLGQSINDCGGYIFYGCNAITTVENYSPCFFDEFVQLPNLTTVVLGGGKTSTGRFYSCPKLTSVTIGGNIGKISDLAFENCPALTSITIPNTVTAIGNSAFRGTGLGSIVIPASVTTMGSRVFMDTPLDEIIFTGNLPAMDASSSLAGIFGTAYYPAANTTWTAEALQNYGGLITWEAQ